MISGLVTIEVIYYNMSNLIFPQGQASYAAVEMLQSSHIQDQYKKLMVVVAAATTNIGVNTLFLVI